MKTRNLFNPFLLSLVFAALSFTACDDEGGEGGFNGDPNRDFFNLVLGVGDDGNDGVYMQAQDDLSKGEVTFKGFGFEVPAERTARIAASEDGKYAYSLDYGGGTITKFSAKGGQVYNQLSKIDVSDAIGTHPRWAMVSNSAALLHNVTTQNKYKDVEGTVYDYTEGTAQLVVVNLGDKDAQMSLGAIQKLVIPRSEEDKTKNLCIWRIDAPVVHKGKAYYGVAKRGYDPNTGKTVSGVEYATTTLVADYPSLTNLKTISSTQAIGENYGYRTPVNYVDEKNDIYQIVGNGVKASILKIKNEAYDDTYKFDLSEALGFEVGALGWFYVGNGIGYVPFYDLEKGQSAEESAWGVARVDVYKKTAVKMNLPYGLWMRQYQKGVLKNGKFYMSLAPVGKDGAVFMFDPTSTSPDGFKTGAVLKNLVDQFYIGIF